ncbi:MAG: hypothetical protein M3Y07_07630 [Acidobacteriota bacterium]|nr:hypothetical protein [Acidobacteriota bacterium]
MSNGQNPDRDKQADDSDIVVNGGAPIGKKADGDTDKVGPCGGLDVWRKAGYPGYDTDTRLTITGGISRKIWFAGSQSIDLSGQNWLLYIHPHLVVIHTFDEGKTVEIDNMVGKFQQQTDNHRKHCNTGEIEKLMLFVDGQLPTPLPGCRFTIVYR